MIYTGPVRNSWISCEICTVYVQNGLDTIHWMVSGDFPQVLACIFADKTVLKLTNCVISAGWGFVSRGLQLGIDGNRKKCIFPANAAQVWGCLLSSAWDTFRTVIFWLIKAGLGLLGFRPRISRGKSHCVIIRIKSESCSQVFASLSGRTESKTDKLDEFCRIFFILKDFDPIN